MIEVIPLKFGVTFKRVFSQPDIFMQFAQDILGISLNIQQVHTEYEYPEPIGFVKTKYDLFAEDPEQRIIVEIQHVKEEDFFNRFLYYHLISLAEQVKSYAEYDFERTVYTIVVLTSVPQDGSINFSCAISDMNPTDEKGNRLSIYDHRLVFLVPRLVNEDTPPAVRAWLDLIADSLDGKVNQEKHPSLLFERVIEAMKKTTITPEELSQIKDEAAWEKAKARFALEGRAEGRAVGRIEGRVEGRVEGRAEGEVYGQVKLIKSMRERGLEVSEIADMTGLSVADIDALLEHPNPYESDKRH